MSRPDEGMIHAWLDGELDAVEAAQVAKLVAEDAEWGAAAAEARGLIAASSRIVSALDVVPAGVVPAGTRAAGTNAAPSVKPRFTVRPWMRMAAGVVLVVGTATAVMTRNANAPAPAVSEEVAGLANNEKVNAVTSTPSARVLTDEVRAIAEGQVTKSTVGAQPVVAEKTSAPLDAGALEREVDAAKSAKTAGAVASANEAVAGVRERVAGSALGGTAAPSALAETRRNAPARDASGREAVARQSRALEAAPAAAAPAVAAPAAALQYRLEQSADLAADARPVLAGCWRAQVAGRADTLLSAPAITVQAGDTLTIVVAADGRTAVVRRSGADTLRGETRIAGAVAVFVALRAECPRTP